MSTRALRSTLQDRLTPLIKPILLANLKLLSDIKAVVIAKGAAINADDAVNAGNANTKIPAIIELPIP